MPPARVMRLCQNDEVNFVFELWLPLGSKRSSPSACQGLLQGRRLIAWIFIDLTTITVPHLGPSKR